MVDQKSGQESSSQRVVAKLTVPCSAAAVQGLEFGDGEAQPGGLAAAALVVLGVGGTRRGDDGGTGGVGLHRWSGK